MLWFELVHELFFEHPQPTHVVYDNNSYRFEGKQMVPNIQTASFIRYRSETGIAYFLKYKSQAYIEDY
jgi:hypothetical protein